MSQSLSPVIAAEALLKIYQTENIVIVDASNGKDVKDNYDKKHLDGALFADVNTQLADIKPNLADGGRHPLPTPEQFSKTLGDLGITPSTHVVVYDDKNGANAAARFWWMLKAIGHDKVQVLDGGIQAAEKAGFPVNGKKVEPAKAAHYPIKAWGLPVAGIDEVEKAAADKNHIVIDVREAARYKGITEPIDTIAGHIPGAVNVPFTNNLTESGLMRSPAELKAEYEKIFGDTGSGNIIIHCGSGVTACHTLMAIAHAGMEIPKLYVGSWSEWSRNDKPVGKEE